jgi:adenylate cyclase class IV
MSYEVELKFKITPIQKAALIKQSKFLSKKSFVDIYYDTPCYKLSLNDVWLRTRNNVFLLKVPINGQDYDLLKLQTNTPKNEIEDLIEIRRILNLNANIEHTENLHADLIKAGYLPLYTYHNIREKYQHDKFIIDFDTATWNDKTFEVCEIELLVEEENIPQALTKIENFAKNNGLSIEPVEARLIEIIKIQNPEHYHLLKQKILISSLPLQTVA